MKDLSKIPYEKHTKKQWEKLIKALNSGEKIKIHPTIYAYFLEVLPPKKMFDSGFVFAEGFDTQKVFWKEGNDYFCVQPRTKEQFKKLVGGK